MQIPRIRRHVQKPFVGQLNLVVVRLFDEARARAKEADAAVDKGLFWGPLHGGDLVSMRLWVHREFVISGNSRYFIAMVGIVMVVYLYVLVSLCKRLRFT